MIQLKALNKTYRAGDSHLHALNNINLEIASGEIFGFIGKSGAGKSTLLRCINLLEKPDSGQVIIDGLDISSLRETDLRTVRKNIAMIFQHFNLLSTKTVYGNVALPLKIANQYNKNNQQYIHELLELVGLSDKAFEYPENLSGGQKQRVAIARALATRPNILLCDEPTSALDPQTMHSILKLLKTINQQFDITIVLITHEMEVIKSICDRVAVIDDGRIEEINHPLELLIQPKSNAARSMIQANIREHLPETIVRAIEPQPSSTNNPLLRLAFARGTVQQPLIAKLVNTLNVSINILQADISLVQSESVGTMLVEFIGSQQQLKQAHEMLEQWHVTVEIMGYMATDTLR